MSDMGVIPSSFNIDTGLLPVETYIVLKSADVLLYPSMTHRGNIHGIALRISFFPQTISSYFSIINDAPHMTLFQFFDSIYLNKLYSVCFLLHIKMSSLSLSDYQLIFCSSEFLFCHQLLLVTVPLSSIS